MSEESFVYTCCPGWGDHEFCAIKTIVKDGKIVRTEKAQYTGAEANEGYICQKGIMSCRQPYNEKRLTRPLKRVGERGEGKWEETIVAADPDVIFTNVNYIDDPVGEILGRDGWAGVTAIANRDVYYIDSNASSQPNQNIVVALRQMAEALYPDYFAAE